jgi:hypothetical protein
MEWLGEMSLEEANRLEVTGDALAEATTISVT